MKKKEHREPSLPSVSVEHAPTVKKFVLQRNEDETGNSGCGIVAIGVLFNSGMCCMEWNTIVRSIGIYNSIADVTQIHGHGGKTVVQWID